jgi:hypothetical protein
MIKITVNEYAGDCSQSFTVECDSLTQALTIMAQYHEQNNSGAEKCENSENMAQESVEASSTGVDWSGAPEWATMYGKVKDCGSTAYYNKYNYTYEHDDFGQVWSFRTDLCDFDDITPIAKREL